MNGYVKLFGSTLASTIWREDHATRIVWITMLIMKDADGLVEASIPGLADLARVTIDECESALEKLSTPDRYSRSVRDDGRRIRRVDGGWVIVNHDTYRDKHTTEEIREKSRIRKAEYRRRKSDSGQSQMSRSVPSRPQMSRHTDTDTDTNADTEQDQDLHVAESVDPAIPQIENTRAPRAREAVTETPRNGSVTPRNAKRSSFDVFWEAYPKKAKRPDAEMVWQTISPSPDLVATILNAVTWQVESPAWKDAGGRFIPNAVNWLLDKRWEEKQPRDPSDEAFERVMRGEGILR